MASPAILSAAAPPINAPPSAVKNRAVSPSLCACTCDCVLTVRNSNGRSRSNQVSRIKAAAIVENPATSEEEEIQAKVGARVRVTVPLKVYHIPKVAEVDLNGKEGKLNQYVAVWKGKHISANLPYKIEFYEKLEGRGDAPMKFFAHLKDDEFEFLD